MAKKNNSVKKSIEDNKRITNKGIYILITCVLLIAIVVVIVLLINKKDTKELKKDVVAPIVNEEKGVIQDQEYDGLTFTIGGTSITLTALAIAAIAGILLNAILPGNDYEFGKNPAGDSSRGVYVMNTDSEKEESEDNK